MVLFCHSRHYEFISCLHITALSSILTTRTPSQLSLPLRLTISLLPIGPSSQEAVWCERNNTKRRNLKVAQSEIKRWKET